MTLLNGAIDIFSTPKLSEDRLWPLILFSTVFCELHTCCNRSFNTFCRKEDEEKMITKIHFSIVHYCTTPHIPEFTLVNVPPKISGGNGKLFICWIADRYKQLSLFKFLSLGVLKFLAKIFNLFWNLFHAPKMTFLPSCPTCIYAIPMGVAHVMRHYRGYYMTNKRESRAPYVWH